MLIIQASNVHQGGGRVLLEEIIRAMIESQSLPPKNNSGVPSHEPLILFVDRRFQVLPDWEQKLKIIKVSPSIPARLKVEFLIKKWAKEGDRVLCFGNLPPLFKPKATVSLFFQNVILFKENSFVKFKLRTQIKHKIERIWIRYGLRHVSQVVVQTFGVQRTFQKEFNFSKIKILPFVKLKNSSDLQISANKKNYDFIYVASGDPHKNHQKLVDAWILLAKENKFPVLCLTVANHYQDLLKYVYRKKEEYKLKIFNFGENSRDEILNLYSQSHAAIYPSLCESFGLPLLEARQYGLSIVAAELDYVRDLLDPAESFDPNSAVSIARAVKRFLQIQEQKVEICSTATFLHEVFTKKEELKNIQHMESGVE